MVPVCRCVRPLCVADLAILGRWDVVEAVILSQTSSFTAIPSDRNKREIQMSMPMARETK